MPGFKHLYWNDRIIRGAVNNIGFGLMVLAGMWWISQPQPNVAVVRSPEDLAFDAQLIVVGKLIGVALVVVSALVLVWRYLWVKKVLTSGITVKGTVEKLENAAFRTNEGSVSKPAYRHVYWATVRYAVHGMEQEVCIKLPNSGFTFGLVQGRETDLIVLDTSPRKPLIRAIYTESARPMPGR